MEKRFKFGMVGSGEIAFKATAVSIKESSNACMVMCLDPVEQVAASFGKEYGIPYTTKLEELLANPEVEGVIISAPHHLHAPIAIQAAQAGKHVIVEKPMATKVKDAQAMIKTAREARVALSTLFPFRFNEETSKAKELISKKVLGEIIGIHFHSIGGKAESYWEGGYSGRVKTDWRKKWETAGGGYLIMNMVHYLDQMWYITGLKPERVYAEFDTYKTKVEVEDFITVTMRYKDGPIGSLFAASCIQGDKSRGNKIFGTLGQMEVGSPLRIFLEKEAAGLKAGEWNEIPLAQEVEPRRMLIESFVNSLCQGKEPPVYMEEGIKSLELIEAAYESGRTHKPVSL